MNSSKIFCLAPFINYTYKNNSSHITQRPCCETEDDRFMTNSTDITDNFFYDYWNGDFINEIRKTMLENKPHEVCTKCFQTEQLTGYSARSQYDEWVKTYKIENINLDKPLSMDYRPSNLCNLKCRMCSPSSSSEWAEEVFENQIEYKNIGPLYGPMSTESHLYDKKKSADYRVVKIPTTGLKRVKFLGGEPFMSEEIFDFCSKWVESGVAPEMILNFTTNATNFSKKWIDLLKHFKQIRLTISLDSIEENFEYIRTSANWKKVSSNFINIQKNTNFKVKFSFTLQMYNIFNCLDIVKWLLEWNKEYKNSLDHEHFFAPVSYNWLSTNVLTEEDTNKIKKQLIDFSTANPLSFVYIEQILKIMDFDKLRDDSTISDIKEQFKNWTLALDKIRKTSLTDINEEYKKYLI